MKNPKQYLLSLMRKHSDRIKTENLHLKSDYARQSFVDMTWRNISDVEIIPLAGGGFEANIAFKNGVMIGNAYGTRIPTFEEAEVTLARMARHIKQPKKYDLNDNGVLFCINDTILNVPPAALLKPNYFSEMAKLFGKNVSEVRDDHVRMACAEIDSCIETYGNKLDGKEIADDDKLSLTLAMAIIIASGRNIYLSDAYRAERRGSAVPLHMAGGRA